jgi:hypothetical protein
MEENMEAKNCVSRRNFLKGLGGGAIGTAIVSTQLLDPGRVEGAAAAKGKPTSGIKKKGGTLQWSDAEPIRKRVEEILKDLEGHGARQINMRLNRSDTDDKAPIFVDWYGTKDLAKRLEEKAGKLDDIRRERFGDQTPAKVYNEALDKAPKELAERDWSDCGKWADEKNAGSRLLAQKAKVLYQRFIAIIADDSKGQRRRVGTIAVGFDKKPDAKVLAEVDEKLKKWASWPPNSQSALVRDLKKVEISLGGPFLKT